MAKTIIVWTEVKYYDFPEDAPTDDIDNLREYLGDHQDDDWEHFCVGTEQLEGEILT